MENDRDTTYICLFFDLHSTTSRECLIPSEIPEGEAKDEGNEVRAILNAEDKNAMKNQRTKHQFTGGLYKDLCMNLRVYYTNKRGKKTDEKKSIEGKGESV